METEVGQILYSRAADLLEADVGDELVALDPAQGSCFGFNAVAATVWRELAEPKSFEQLTESLRHQYEVDERQCAEELKELLDDMTDRRLIESRTTHA